jgi:hypothetical protein
VVTAFCYEQEVLTSLCNWVAIVLQGYINFVVPALLYRSALDKYALKTFIELFSRSACPPSLPFPILY